jgi:parvulin-like peptidyl-prolyl isomerase
MARWQKDRRRQRVAQVLIAIVILVVLGVLGYGYYANIWSPPRKILIDVNGARYSRGDIVDSLRVIQAQYRAVNQSIDLGVTPFEVVQSTLYNELALQAAPRMGIYVSDDQIEEAIRQLFYPEPDEDQVVSEENLDREYDERIRYYLTQTRQTMDDVRRVTKFELVNQMLRLIVGDQVPLEAEHANVQWITVTSGEEFTQVQERLANGEEFEVISKEFAPETGPGAGDGVVGWISKGAYPELDEVLFSIEPGTVSEPVSGPASTYFLKVLQLTENRTVSDYMMSLLKDHALSDWFQNEIQQNDVKTNFDSDDYSWIVEQLRQSEGLVLTPRGGQDG